MRQLMISTSREQTERQAEGINPKVCPEVDFVRGVLRAVAASAQRKHPHVVGFFSQSGASLAIFKVSRSKVRRFG